VRARGFDHTTQQAIAAAAGVSRALGLDVEKTANAVAIAATTSPALRVTRTGTLSHWKGLAAPDAAAAGTRAALLARHGITGPPEAFEGNKGFMDSVSGPFFVDWQSENLERVTRTSIKRYDAEFHAQSAIEALLDLLSENGIAPREIQRIEVDVFDVAYRIIGGGEEGDKTVVRTKEQADHSLPYMLAVAALDGDVMPAQYMADRIARADVQDLLRGVTVRSAPDLSARFPAEHPCRVRITLDGGRILSKEKRDYLGFYTRPMSWDLARSKFARLATRLAAQSQTSILNAVTDLRLRVALGGGVVS
jgi:2-methylcitrate dehydratase